MKFLIAFILVVSPYAHAASNATVVKEGEFRQTVALVFKNTPERDLGEIFCSGTLIGPRLVITAAHCIYLGAKAYGLDYTKFVDSMHIYIGENDVDQPMVRPAHKVADFVLHPAYREELNDFALLTLSEDVNLEASGITPVPLSKPGVLSVGSSLTSVGYGSLRNGGLKGIKTYFELPVRYVGPSMIEAGDYKKSGPSACHGDSGGSAYAKDESGKTVFVAVTVSISPDVCGEAVTSYLGFTDATLKWILENGELF